MSEDAAPQDAAADFDPFDVTPLTMSFSKVGKGPYTFRELSGPMQKQMDQIGERLGDIEGDAVKTVDALCEQIELMFDGAKEDGLRKALVAGFKSGAPGCTYQAVMRAHGKVMEWAGLAEASGNA